jgi:hypothetical protein
MTSTIRPTIRTYGVRRPLPTEGLHVEDISHVDESLHMLARHPKCIALLV